MFYVKNLVLCVIVSVSMWQHIDAAKLSNPKNNKRHDEGLQTYIYESNVEDDVQADQPTTVYPPLIEEPSNPASDGDDAGLVSVSHETQPPRPSNENNIVYSPESTFPSTSDSPVPQNVGNPYAGSSPYYFPYYPLQGYQNFPYSLVPQQQQQQYYAQPNMGQQSVYFPSQVQPEFEGLLVPVQTSMQPTRSQSPSLIQSTQTQSAQLSSPVTQNAGAAPATTNAGGNSENNKMPTSLSHRNSFDLALLLQAILPQNIIQLIIIIGNFVLNSFSTLAFAGAITSLLCSLTPVCTISFGSIPFGVRKILIDGGEMSSIQRVRRAAEMVTNAIDKYEQIQKGVESLTHSLKQTQKKP